MRSPLRVLLFLLLGPGCAVPVFAAGSLERHVEFVNATDQPVYAIRIGHRATGDWSGDLLGPTQVVDVGESRPVAVRLSESCWYDVRYEYRGGRAEELDDVDLCSATRVFLRGTSP